MTEIISTAETKTPKLTQIIDKYKGVDTVFLIANGPSIEALEIDLLDANKHFMIVCNTAFRRFPQAKIAHHADYNWWKEFRDELQSSFQGELITGVGLGCSPNPYPPEVDHLDFDGREFMPINTQSVSGMNAGQQIVSMAHMFGPKRIVMLGFDHTFAPDGRSHAENSSPLAEYDRMKYLWDNSMKWFTELSQKREQWWIEQGFKTPLPQMINASPNSAINDYEKVSSIKPYL